MSGKNTLLTQAYLKPPLQYSEPIRRIRVIKLNTDPDANASAPDRSIEAFIDFVLSEEKEFIIINLSDFFPFQELLNRCINLEIHPLSLTSVLNVLYCIHAWLQNDAHNVFLHNSGSMYECELILTCYFLWTTLQTATPLSEIAYQDILLDIVRADNPTASIDQIPHSVVNVLRNFYSLLLDENTSLSYGRSLVFKNCQILGLFLKNHLVFSKPPIIIIGTGHRVLFSSRSDIDSVIWNQEIGELIVVCSVQIQGDFYISCFADDSEVGSSSPLFFYSYNTLFLDSDLNVIVSSDLDCSTRVEEKTLTMTLLSAAMEGVSSLPPFLKPSECFQAGLSALVRNHSLQLSPTSKQCVAKEEESQRLLLHFGLLLFDGNEEKAREFVAEERKGKSCEQQVEKKEEKGVRGEKEEEEEEKKEEKKEEEPEKKEEKKEEEPEKKEEPEKEEVREEKEEMEQKEKEEEEKKKEEKKKEEKKKEEPEKEEKKMEQKKEEEKKNEEEKVMEQKEETPPIPSLSTIPIIGMPPTSAAAESLPKSFAKTTTTPKGRKGVALRFHPQLRDFFDWWLDDKLDKNIVEASMKEDGIDPAVLSRDPREVVAEDDYNVVFALLEEVKDGCWYFIRRRNHPLFAKYYNKLALGAKEEEVREQMVQEGVDPQVLELDQNKWIVVS